MVFGRSVADQSDAGGAIRGLEALEFSEPVSPGDTLSASSEVLGTQESES